MRDPALDGSSALIICRSCRPVMERDTSGQGRHLGRMSSKWFGPKIGYNCLQMAVLMVKMMIKNWYTVKIEGKKKDYFQANALLETHGALLFGPTHPRNIQRKTRLCQIVVNESTNSGCGSFSTGWNNSCIRMLLLNWEKAQELERNRGSTEVNHWNSVAYQPTMPVEGIELWWLQDDFLWSASCWFPFVNHVLWIFEPSWACDIFHDTQRYLLMTVSPAT